MPHDTDFDHEHEALSEADRLEMARYIWSQENVHQEDIDDDERIERRESEARRPFRRNASAGKQPKRHRGDRCREAPRPPHVLHLAARRGQLGDLLQRRVDVGGPRGGHRLDADREVAADADPAHVELAGLPAGGEDGRGCSRHTEADGDRHGSQYPLTARSRR